MNPDFTFAYAFGKLIATEGQLISNPSFIAIDNQGSVYVINDRKFVQKFSSEGKFICQIGGFGSGPGQLHSPTGELQ